MDDRTSLTTNQGKVRRALGLLAGVLCCALAHADIPGPTPADRNEAQVPMATKLLDAPMPEDLTAFNVVLLELDDLGFKQSAAQLRDYDQRRTLRRLVGDPASHASTFREALVEEAAESSIADYIHAVINKGLSIDFEAPASGDNFAHYPNVEYRQIEPGMWGMFRSGDAEKTVDTAIGYELPFTVTSRLTERVRLSFDLPRMDVEQNLRCFVDNVPTGVPVAASCDIQAPTDPDARHKMLAALRQLRADNSALVPVSGSVSPPSTYAYPQQQEAMVTAYNLVHQAGCKETGTCVPGQMKARTPWLLPSLLLVGLVYSAWRRLSGRSGGRMFQKGARVILATYAVVVALAVALSVLDAGTKAPLSGVLGFLAAFVASLPWSLLALPAFGELADLAALKLMWGGAAINMVYLWIMAYGGPAGELDDRAATERNRR